MIYAGHDGRNITSLPENTVFVFGSNTKGDHKGGAAAAAVKFFGALNGVGEGIQGQSYAIPTLDNKYKKIPFEQLFSGILNFKNYATNNPEKRFHLTDVGCGLAGYNPVEIAPYFNHAPSNVLFSKIFANYIFDPLANDEAFPEQEVLEVLFSLDTYYKVDRAFSERCEVFLELPPSIQRVVSYLFCFDLTGIEDWAAKAAAFKKTYSQTRRFIHWPANTETTITAIYLLFQLTKAYKITAAQLMKAWQMKPHNIPYGL